jgi:hypothetical protein
MGEREGKGKKVRVGSGTGWVEGRKKQKREAEKSGLGI